MSVVGYARVSRQDQQLELQRVALVQAGCEKLFEEAASGARADRPELARLLDWIREGDTVVVWKLDRLGRSLRHLIDTLELLRAKGVGFRSLSEGMDTSTAVGRMLFHVLGALAEFERELIRERTLAGMAAASRRGHRPGPKPKLVGEKLTNAQRLYDSGEYTMAQLSRLLGVGESTLYRALKVTPALDPELVSQLVERAQAASASLP